MSVEQNLEILCDACLEPKMGGAEWETMMLCMDCLRSEIMDADNDGDESND